MSDIQQPQQPQLPSNANIKNMVQDAVSRARQQTEAVLSGQPLYGQGPQTGTSAQETPSETMQFRPWEEIENDPEFAALPYDRQMSIRQQWFDTMAPQNPYWQELTPERRQAARENFLFSEPSVLTEELSSRGQEFLQLAEQIRSGEYNEEEKRELLRTAFSVNAKENGTILRKVTDLAERFLNLSDETQEMLGGTGGEDGQILYSPQTTADQNAFDYLMAVGARDEEIRKGLQRSSAGGLVFGVLSDIGSVLAATSVARTAIRGAAAAASRSASTSRLARFLRTPGIPFATESALESVGFTAVDLAREAYNDEVVRYPSVANRALRAGLLFGENFLIDMAFWSVLRVGGPTVKGLFRTFSPKGYRGEVPRAAAAAEAPNEFLRAALRNEHSSVLRQLPDEVARQQWRRRAQDINRASRMTPDDIGSDEWMQLVATSKGYEITREGTGAARLSRMDVNDKTGAIKAVDMGTFEDIPAAFRKAVEDLDFRRGVEVTDDALTGVKGQVRVTRLAEGVSTMERAEMPFAQMRRLLQPDTSGRLVSNNIRTVAKGLFRRGGLEVSTENLNLRKVDLPKWREMAAKGDGPVVMYNGNPMSWDDLVKRLDAAGTTEGVEELRKVDIVVPDGPVTSDDVATLARGFERVAEAGESRSASRAMSNISEEFSTAEGSFATTRVALKEIGKDLVHPSTGRVLNNFSEVPSNGTVAVRGADGTFQPYSSITEAYLREAPRNWLTEKNFSRWLKDQFGYKLQQSKDGRYFIRRQGKVLRGGEGYASLDDILLDNPDLFPKRPISSYSGDIELDYDTQRLVVDTGRISGPPDEVHDFLSKTFAKSESKALEAKTFETPYGRVLFEPDTTRYRVEIDDLGFKREFDSIDKAKKFLQRSKDDFEVMNDIALAGGSELEFVDGVFRLALPDGSYAVSRSLEGIRPSLQKLAHDTDAVPNLLREVNLPEGYLRSLEKRYRHFSTPSMGTPNLTKEGRLEDFVRDNRLRGQGAKKRRKFGTFFRPFETIARNLSNDIADDSLFRSVYKTPRAAFDAFRQKYSAVENTIEAVFKGLNKKETRVVRELLLDPSKNAEELLRQIGGRTRKAEDIVNAAQESRRILNIAAEEFGFDGYKFLRDYLPRIRRHFEGADSAVVNLNESAGETFRRIGFEHYKNIPELKFFAENLRTRDIYEMSRTSVQGADQLLLSYFRKGLRKKYMSEAYNGAMSKVNEVLTAGKIDKDMARFLTSYVDEITGLAENAARREIFEGTEDAIRDFLSKTVGMKEGPTMEHILATMRVFTIGAHMSFRPFLPLRNMMQPWLTTAWRLGNDAVLDAMKYVTDNPHKIVRELIEQDIIIHGKAAILEMVESSSRSRLKHLIETGMIWFRNSDDYNRAVTAVASWIPYDNAVARLKKGMPREEFITAARLDRLPPDIQRDVLRYTDAGDHKTAKNILAKAWVDQTQFPYIQAGNPRVFKGVLGKMFGMYGHYPTMFRENIALGFGSHVPKKVKFQSAARLALNALGLYFFFERALGINARNFNPISAVRFTGGPYYNLLNTAIQAHGSGFQAEIARSRLTEETFRNFLPGASFIYSYNQAQDLIERGYYTEGYLRALSFPVIDPDRPTAR